jgi:hypothetical protein
LGPLERCNLSHWCFLFPEAIYTSLLFSFWISFLTRYLYYIVARLTVFKFITHCEWCQNFLRASCYKLRSLIYLCIYQIWIAFYLWWSICNVNLWTTNTIPKCLESSASSGPSEDSCNLVL